ncbi:MAG: MarR family transcriptional regulator [Acidobacteriota bacterium]
MEKKDLIDTLQDDWRRERPDLDASAMGVVGRLVVLGELLKRRATDALSPFELGYSDLDTLATLRRSGPPFTLRPAALLNSVLIQSGSLTACLDRLERKGLVERVAIPGDRRGRAVRLAPAGRELVDRAIDARFLDATDSVAALDPTERATLETLLRRLLNAQQPTEGSTDA